MKKIIAYMLLIVLSIIVIFYATIGFEVKGDNETKLKWNCQPDDETFNITGFCDPDDMDDGSGG